MGDYKVILIEILLFGMTAGTLGATYFNTPFGAINYTGSGYYFLGGRYQYISSQSALTYQSTTTMYPITIQTSPTPASNYWGACFSTAYNGSNQTCTSDSLEFLQPPQIFLQEAS